MVKEANEAVANMIYEFNLPFNIADTHAFKRAFAAATKLDEAWTPSSVELIRTSLLQARVESL